MSSELISIPKEEYEHLLWCKEQLIKLSEEAKQQAYLEMQQKTIQTITNKRYEQKRRFQKSIR